MIPHIYRKWIAALAVCFIVMFLIMAAYPAQASREQIAKRYNLNSIYLSNSSYPGSHTVTKMEFNIMCLPGVNSSYVKESIKGLNPFYGFKFIDPDPSKYLKRSDGLFYSTDEKTIVISMKPGQCTKCGCGTTGQCCPITLWIDTQNPITPKQFGKILEHECDHMAGRADERSGDDLTLTSEEVTDRYTEQSKTRGSVIINSITGSGSDSWMVYL